MRIVNKNNPCPLFEYVEGIRIRIRYVNDEETQAIMKRATEVSFDRSHRMEKEINSLAFNRAVLRKAIVGWDPFPRRKLKWLIEPGKTFESEKNESPEDMIIYSDEIRDMICENTHIDFSNFVTMSARRAEAFIAAEEKEELENLKRSSGGK